MSGLLEARDLVCGYGDKAITETTDLTVQKGEILALIGPNGSGKSTLLKTLAGSLKPLRGTVTIDGQPLAGMAEHNIARLVAVVPQDEAYSFRFSVRQIVAMGRLSRSGSFFETKEDDSAIDKALERADCQFLKDRPITETSGGERQRTLIARALAQETPLLVMDEPTSHLDVGHAVEFVRLTKSLAADGKAIILAVHDINVALSAAHRIILLECGRTQFIGTPRELIQSKKAEAVYGIRFHVNEFEGTFSVSAKMV